MILCVKDQRYLPKEIDQNLEKERSKYFIKNVNLIQAQQRKLEEEKKMRELKGGS